ncbi:LOW QUALITY PROTEIN: uncharacterized protein FYN16_000746 [Cariama cristata]
MERGQMVYVTETKLRFDVPKESGSCKGAMQRQREAAFMSLLILEAHQFILAHLQPWFKTPKLQKHQRTNSFFKKKREYRCSQDTPQAADNDNLNAVQLLVMEGPQHGWITVGSSLYTVNRRRVSHLLECENVIDIPVSMCFQRDLFYSLVYHQHFGEEIFQDAFEFILSDSQEPPNLDDQITIFKTDASCYTSLKKPGTTQLVVKETCTITRYQHDDSETLEDTVIFSATDGFNTADGVLRVQLDPMFPHYLAPKRTKELHMGLMLLYMHDDTESLEDTFTVQLTDGKRTVQGTLYIYIMPVNDEIPHLSSMGLEVEAAERVISSAGSEADTKDAPGDELGRTVPVCPGDIVLLAKPVTLTEGDRVTLTTDVPVATDGTSKPEKLLYAVSLPPVHGQIEHINYPGVPISSYSQLDVVAQKVSDVHDNSHGAGKESLR